MDGAGTSRTTAIAHLGPSRQPAGSAWSFTRLTSCARAMAGARAKHNNKHAPFCIRSVGYTNACDAPPVAVLCSNSAFCKPFLLLLLLSLMVVAPFFVAYRIDPTLKGILYSAVAEWDTAT